MHKSAVRLFFLLLLLPIAACADDTFQAGHQYKVLEEPVRVRDTSKVEVVEVFWYGCGHCFTFDPMVTQWAKQQASDVDFHHVPAIWNDMMKVHARAYYTADVLDILEKMHPVIFEAMHKQKLKLANMVELQNLFAKHGVDKDAFKKAYQSFGVGNSATQADAKTRSYKITGTPEMVVNGKYRVSARDAGGQKKMLEVVDFLVEKERQLLKASAK